MKVVHLVSTEDGANAFYEAFVGVERSAAARLSIELEVVYCGLARAAIAERGAAIAARTSRPDYVLLPNYQGAAHDLLPTFDAAGIRSFLVVEGMTSTDRLPHGTPRTKHPQWIGELVPDDVAAGRDLAATLADQARAQGLVARDGRIHVGILSGPQSFAGQSRFHGWLGLKRDRPDLVQASVQYANWDETVARSAAALMLRSHPEITVLWAASDAMALGAIDAARECGRNPGKDLLVGGIDLVPRALQQVEGGSMAVTFGGHLIDGARALILLHDHFHGNDFAPWSRRSSIEPVTAAQARSYRRFFEGRGWEKVDFTRYSRARTGSASAPELTLKALV